MSSENCRYDQFVVRDKRIYLLPKRISECGVVSFLHVCSSLSSVNPEYFSLHFLSFFFLKICIGTRSTYTPLNEKDIFLTLSLVGSFQFLKRPTQQRHLFVVPRTTAKLQWKIEPPKEPSCKGDAEGVQMTNKIASENEVKKMSFFRNMPGERILFRKQLESGTSLCV